MEEIREYLDLQGRRATVYLLWRRALAEYQLNGKGDDFVAAIAEVTQELRDVRLEAQALCEGMSEGQAIALRIEALEDQHLRDMVQYQQGKVSNLDVSLAAVCAIEQDISDLMLELLPEGSSYQLD